MALGEVLNLTYVRNVVDESGTVYDGQFEYPYIKGGKNLFGDPRRYRVHHASNWCKFPNLYQLLISSGQSTQPYKYNGKEFIEMHGYDTYDYGFRGYYPAVGRFTTVDPLAEKEYAVSPYVYCGNNSINRIDPTGMKWANKETRQEVDKLRANIISATSQTKKLIKEGRIDPKDGEARLADLKHALLERPSGRICNPTPKIK